MPNLQGIRRRIKAVRNMRQITKAMKLVSASKLKRAQDRVTATRPYAEKIREILKSLAATQPENYSNPLMEQRPGNKILLVLITSDKGLCGAFNTNLIRAASLFIKDNPENEIELLTIGRRGRDFFRRRGIPIRKEFVNLMSKPMSYETAAELAREIIDIFIADSNNENLSEELSKEKEPLLPCPDKVIVIYNEFRSALQQVVQVKQLLPIETIIEESEIEKSAIDYIYEQPSSEIFTSLLPRYVEAQIFQSLLESTASEHGARMAAMDSASRNANEVINALTLKMNRIRQASITNEIIEIVSGAAAL